MPAINPLPTAPSTLRPDTFASEMDAFLAALPGFASELDAVGSAAALGTTSTSTTTLAFGAGAKTLTVDPGKGYVPGMDVAIASAATPTNRMIGTVTAYNVTTGAMSVTVTVSVGSGSASAWSVSVTTAGDSFVVSGGPLGTPSSGNLANCLVNSNKIGYLHIPLVPAAANTLMTKALAGGGLKHPAADTTARTFTVDSNANQSWEDGTTISVWNVFGTGGIVTITALDTMRWANGGVTGSRALARGGFATLVWDSTSASWVITGAGLS